MYIYVFNLNSSLSKDIVWKYKDVVITDSDHYSINKAVKVDGIVSTLTVKGLQEADFGEYVCNISNGHGEDAFTVTLLRVCKIYQVETWYLSLIMLLQTSPT